MANHSPKIKHFHIERHNVRFLDHILYSQLIKILYHQDVERVFEVTRAVMTHFWPHSERSPPSRWHIQEVAEQLGIRLSIPTLYRTYDTLLSLAPVEVLEQYQDERAKLEEEIWYDAIRAVQPGSSLDYVIETVFLPLYCSLDDKSIQESFCRCKKDTRPQCT